MNNIRLRFAPSPTGFLHLGNFRTALFGYLLAKSLGGKFILRIEDTDEKREVAGAVESLLDILSWSSITFDEGPHLGGDFSPYIQTERLDVYKKYTEELLSKGEAYHCFCSEERLQEMRNEQTENKLPPRYDRKCRDLSKEEVKEKIDKGEKYVIRQKMPLAGEITVHDEIRGDITFKCSELEDHVLIKSDGIPTYQFANIVDDHLMEISHVTRGDEWLPSFPKNILLYKSFSWTPPKFIHFPLILNQTGGKLSKRQGDVYVENYKQKGYLPEAIVNFSALLGWHSKDEKEIYTLSELEESFSLSGLGSSPAIFDPIKLDYYNSHYLRQKSVKELTVLCRPYVEKKLVDDILLEKIVTISQDRLKKLEEIKDIAEGFISDKLEYEPELLIWKTLTRDDVKNNLTEISAILKDIAEKQWTKEHLEETIIGYLKSNSKKNGDYLWPMRVALSGEKNSPSPFELAWVLGKEKTLALLQLAQKK
jgi:glutamyl-tRNA synthetase